MRCVSEIVTVWGEVPRGMLGRAKVLLGHYTYISLGNVIVLNI